MGFSATIVFTGICGIVPKANPFNAPGAFCVVLPNAWKTKPSPVSDITSKVDQISRLRRHAAFIQFTTQPVDTTNRRQNLEGLWYLLNHRLFIEPTFESGDMIAAWGDISGLAAYSDVASDQFHHLLSVADAVLRPDPGKVGAQVIVRNGTLAAPRENVKWVFDSYLYRPTSGPLTPVTKRLNPRVTITLQNLASLRIIQRNFGGQFIRETTLSTGPAFVTVANLCDENPLQWGEPPSPDRLADDDDFRWHYELVDHPDDLGTALERLRCPIPRITKTLSNGNGLNCIPMRFSAVNFGF